MSLFSLVTAPRVATPQPSRRPSDDSPRRIRTTSYQHKMPKHTCNVCGKTLSRSTKLTEHLRSHTGERPFTCTHFGCGKSFFRSYDLTKHTQLHDGPLNKYCCAMSRNGEQWGCGKTFHRKRDLRRHLNRKTGWRCLESRTDCAKTPVAGIPINDGESPLTGGFPVSQLSSLLAELTTNPPAHSTPLYYNTDALHHLYSYVSPRSQTSLRRALPDIGQAPPTSHFQAHTSISAMPEVVPSPTSIAESTETGLDSDSDEVIYTLDGRRWRAQILANMRADLPVAYSMFRSPGGLRAQRPGYSPGLPRRPRILFVDSDSRFRDCFRKYCHSNLPDWILHTARNGFEAYVMSTCGNGYGSWYDFDVVWVNVSPDSMVSRRANTSLGAAAQPMHLSWSWREILNQSRTNNMWTLASTTFCRIQGSTECTARSTSISST